MKPLLLTRDKHIIKIVNQELNKTLRYNLKLQSMQKQDREGNWINIVTQYPFFQGYSMLDIKCEEEKFMGMIEKTKYLNPRCKSVSSFISRLNEALVYENYIKEGIETECSANIGYNGYLRKEVLKKPLEFYPKNVINFFKENKIRVTIDMEEYFIRDKSFMEKVIDCLKYCSITEEQKTQFFIDLTYRSMFEDFRTLVNEFKYDMRSLIHYLFNYLLPFENLAYTDSLNELKDYYEMANKIGRNVKKYPKYLRSMHDIITANYNAYKKEYDELLFEKLRKPELEFEGKEFCIVIPNNSKDIIKEGTDLNHCIGSYIDKILKKEKYIFFLRRTEEKENSLITLELIDNTIINAKGSYNRVVTEDERNFLEAYSKKLNIKLGVKGG